VAVAANAFTILTEDPATANHATRVIWAKDALKNTASMGEQMLWGVVSSPTVIQLGESADDGSIAFIVNQLVAAF
jgi:hypothetical protein